MDPSRPAQPQPEPAPESSAIDPGLLGAWIDRRIEEGIPIAGDEPARAIVAPHIDPARGAKVYGSAYRPLRGHPAERIVILGVGHAVGGAPFAVSDQPIPTPWGPCPVDADFVRSLCEGLPFDPVRATQEHPGERSARHQALFLRRAMDGWDHRTVVPILCSFPWTPRSQRGELDAAIESFATRLAAAIDGRTLVVVGADLAHVGPGFGDGPVDLDETGQDTEARDRALLECVADGDLPGFRDRIDGERDARRICGYPALWTLLRILPGSSGILVDYGQAVDRPGGTLVSYAALVMR